MPGCMRRVLISLVLVGLLGCPSDPDPVVGPDPVIDSIDTTSGPTQGGNIIAIVGQNLTPTPLRRSTTLRAAVHRSGMGTS